MMGPFERNQDLEDMREVVRDFCAEQIGDSVIRSVMESPSGFDRSLWQRLGRELGVLGLAASEQFGGSNLGVQAQAAIMEEMGAALVPGPLVGTLALGIPALSSIDSDEVREQFLPRLISGEKCMAFAVPDAGGRFDSQLVNIEANQDGQDWSLRGVLDHVVDAPLADHILVAASHLAFRRRERAMLRFRRMKTLQKFASVHANVHNHFNQERHLVDRQTYRERRSAALAEWQSLAI